MILLRTILCWICFMGCTWVSLAYSPEQEVKVVRECGTIERGAVVRIKNVAGDAKAFCYGSNHDLSRGNDNNFEIAVSYPEAEPSPCIFFMDDEAKMFFIILVTNSDRDSPVQMNRSTFAVTCPFFPEDDPTSSMVLANSDTSRDADVRLQLLDKDLKEFPSRDLTLGTKVRLKVTATDNGVNGVEPVNCEAVGVESGSRYPVLTDGCNTELLMTPLTGFVTDGRVAFGPVFEIFSFKNEARVKFECQVMLCTTNCNGDSCQKKGRGTYDHGSRLLSVSSATYIIDQSILSNRTYSQIVHVLGSGNARDPDIFTFWAPLAVCGAAAAVAILLACCTCMRGITRLYQVHKNPVPVVVMPQIDVQECMKSACPSRSLSARPSMIDEVKLITPCRGGCTVGRLCSCDKVLDLNSMNKCSPDCDQSCAANVYPDCDEYCSVSKDTRPSRLTNLETDI